MDRKELEKVAAIMGTKTYLQECEKIYKDAGFMDTAARSVKVLVTDPVAMFRSSNLKNIMKNPGAKSMLNNVVKSKRTIGYSGNRDAFRSMLHGVSKHNDDARRGAAIVTGTLAAGGGGTALIMKKQKQKKQAMQRAYDQMMGEYYQQSPDMADQA